MGHTKRPGRILFEIKIGRQKKEAVVLLKEDVIRIKAEFSFSFCALCGRYLEEKEDFFWSKRWKKVVPLSFLKRTLCKECWGKVRRKEIVLKGKKPKRKKRMVVTQTSLYLYGKRVKTDKIMPINMVEGDSLLVSISLATRKR